VDGAVAGSLDFVDNRVDRPDPPPVP